MTKTGKSGNTDVVPTRTKGGRPLTHTEPWSKVTVVLLNRHTLILDRFALDFKQEHGVKLSRAQILRALVESTPADQLEKLMLERLLQEQEGTEEE